MTKASDTLRTHKTASAPSNDWAVKQIQRMMQAGVSAEEIESHVDDLERMGLRTHKGGDGVRDGTSEKSARSLKNAQKKKDMPVLKKAMTEFFPDFDEDLQEQFAEFFEQAVEAEAMLRSNVRTKAAQKVHELCAEYFPILNMSDDDLSEFEIHDLKRQELEARLAEAIEENAALREGNEVQEREAIVAEAKKDMTQAEADKLVTLAEAVEAADTEEFAERVGALAESIKKPAVRTGQTVQELLEEADPKNIVLVGGIDKPETKVHPSDPMYRYVDAINR
jgi:hypothetical protein